MRAYRVPLLATAALVIGLAAAIALGVSTVVVTFSGFLGAFTLVGIVSSVQKTDTTEDYLVAGRSVNPWLTALSAVSTNNSGFMFIGLIGYTYRDGLESIWMMVGWIVGDLAAWKFVNRRIRERSEEIDANSVPALLATDRRGRMVRSVSALAGVMTFVFLGAYAAAQLKAGSTALHSLFGWDMSTGAILGCVIVVIYCFSGGLRASIWTDAVQSIVMLGSMATLLFISMGEAGTPGALFGTLAEIEPRLVELFPSGLRFGFVPFLIGMCFGGFGAVGQPHIVIRSMAIDAPEAIAKARRIYFAWFIPFFLMSILVGLYARVLVPELAAVPADQLVAASEKALPELSVALMPEVLLGVMLAGLFSATMSTADSQILSCSAAVTQDVFPQWRENYLASKAATLSVSLLALAIALLAGQGVFTLVLVAWSVLGAALGSVLLVRVFDRPLSPRLALLMMVVGSGVVVTWQLFGLDGDVFKLAPGMLAALVVYGVGTRVTSPASETAETTEAEPIDP